MKTAYFPASDHTASRNSNVKYTHAWNCSLRWGDSVWFVVNKVGFATSEDKARKAAEAMRSRLTDTGHAVHVEIVAVRDTTAAGKVFTP